jgi:AcrR family transcriptional regulator
MPTESEEASGSAVKGRNAQRSAHTRARLLAAAETVFAHEGLEAATIGHITEAADVGFGTFYLYFANKDEAFRAIVTEGFAALSDELATSRAASVAGGVPWWEAVQAQIATYFRFAVAHQTIFRILFAGSETARALVKDLQEHFATQLEQTLWEGQAQVLDQWYPYPPAPLARAIMGTLNRSIMWWLQTNDGTTPDSLSLEELIAAITRFVIAGLAGQMPQPPTPPAKN